MYMYQKLTLPLLLVGPVHPPRNPRTKFEQARLDQG